MGAARIRIGRFLFVSHDSNRSHFLHSFVYSFVYWWIGVMGGERGGALMQRFLSRRNANGCIATKEEVEDTMKARNTFVL